MSDFDKRLEGLLQVSEQNNFALTTMREQMGVVVSTVKKLEIDDREERAWRSSFLEQYEMDKEIARQRERIEPEESEELHHMIKSRVASLLNDYGIDFSFFKGFCMKAWCDAKAYGNVSGKRGVETKRMFFQSAKDYINSWTPHGFSVEGYRDHLMK